MDNRPPDAPQPMNICDRAEQTGKFASVGAAAGAGAGATVASVTGLPAGPSAAVGAAAGATAAAIVGATRKHQLKISRNPPSEDFPADMLSIIGVIAVPFATVATAVKVARDYGLTTVSPAEGATVIGAAHAGALGGTLGLAIAVGAVGAVGYGVRRAYSQLQSRWASADAEMHLHTSMPSSRPPSPTFSNLTLAPSDVSDIGR